MFGCPLWDSWPSLFSIIRAVVISNCDWYQQCTCVWSAMQRSAMVFWSAMPMTAISDALISSNADVLPPVHQPSHSDIPQQSTLRPTPHLEIKDRGHLPPRSRLDLVRTWPLLLLTLLLHWSKPSKWELCSSNFGGHSLPNWSESAIKSWHQNTLVSNQIGSKTYFVSDLWIRCFCCTLRDGFASNGCVKAFEKQGFHAHPTPASFQGLLS